MLHDKIPTALPPVILLSHYAVAVPSANTATRIPPALFSATAAHDLVRPTSKAYVVAAKLKQN